MDQNQLGPSMRLELGEREQSSVNPLYHGNMEDDDLNLVQETKKPFFRKFSKKQICLICIPFILTGLGTFVGVQTSKVLQIQQSTTEMREFRITHLCDNDVHFQYIGDVINPSSFGATIQPNNVKLSIKRDPDGLEYDTLIGNAVVPELEVSGGTSSITFNGTFTVCPTCKSGATWAIQEFFLGTNVSFVMEMDVDASFDSSVYLVPFSVGTSFSFESYIPGYNSSTSDSESETETLHSFKLLQSDDSENEISTKVGLNLTSTDRSGFKLEVDVPKLQFKVQVDGNDLAIGQSDAFHFGTNQPITYATVVGTREEVPFIKRSLETMLNGGTFKLDVIGMDMEGSTTCLIQELVQGVVVSNELDFASSGDNSAAPSTDIISGVKLNDLRDSTFQVGVDLDFATFALEAEYGIYISLSLIAEDKENPTEREQIIQIDIPIPSSMGEEALTIDSTIKLEDWQLFLTVLDRYIFKDDIELYLIPETKNGTLLSELLPEYHFPPYSNSTQGVDVDKWLDFDLTIKEADNGASIEMEFDITLLDDLSFKLETQTLVAKIRQSPDSDEVGEISLPEIQLYKQGSSLKKTVVQFKSTATDISQKLFSGSDIPVTLDIEYATHSKSSPSFVIPKSFTRSVAIGSEDKASGASDTISLLSASLLGGDDIGTDVVFPCIIKYICDTDNIVYPNTNPNGLFTDLTVGFELGIPALTKVNGPVRFNIHMETDLYIDVGANGFDLGILRVHKQLVISSDKEVLPVVVTFQFVDGQIDDVMETVDLMLKGSDTVFHLKGSNSGNLLSQIASAIKQDVEFIGDTGNSDSKDALGEISLDLVATEPNVLSINAGIGILYDAAQFETKVDFGSISATIKFGHSKVGNQYNIESGHRVAIVNPLGSDNILTILPKNEIQTIEADVQLRYDNGAGQQAMDSIVSDFIWGVEIPVDCSFDVVPPTYISSQYKSECVESSNDCAFTLRTFLTIPKLDSGGAGSFIDSFNIDIADTVSKVFEDLGNLVLSGEKVIRNTLSWPLLISYFNYEIFSYDHDGVLSDCGYQLVGDGHGDSGLGKEIQSPCYFSENILLNLCYPPLNGPQNILEGGNTLTRGSTNQPLRSVVTGKRFVAPDDVGKILLSLDTSIETTARMYDKAYVTDAWCADIRNGVLVAAMQQPGCSDNENMGKNELKCTFLINIKFDLKKYPLGKDSCGSSSEIGFEQGFTGFRDDSNPAWNTLRAVASHGDAEGDVFAKWNQNLKMRITDTFRITFRAKFTDDDKGEAFALNFLGRSPNSSDKLNSGPNELYAVKGLKDPTISVLFSFWYCNYMAVVKNGDLNPNNMRARSFSLASLLDRVEDSFINFSITYDAHAKRMEVRVRVNDGSENYDGTHEFDLDLQKELGSNDAWIGLSANFRDDSSFFVSRWTGYSFDGFKGEVDSSDSLKAIIDPDALNTLPRAKEYGTVKFWARDPELRYRGAGGDSWNVEIYDAHLSGRTGEPILQGTMTNGNPTPNCNLCIVDNDDGSYTIRYNIANSGRYAVYVSCTHSNCKNRFQWVQLTFRLFIRSEAALN